MSDGSSSKKNGATAGQESVAAKAAAPEVVDYDWRDARRDQNNTQSNEEFITDIAGLTNEGLSYFNGDEKGVRDYFTVTNLADMDFGDVAWTEIDYDDGKEVDRVYVLTQRDLDEMADLVIRKDWHLADKPTD